MTWRYRFVTSLGTIILAGAMTVVGLYCATANTSAQNLAHQRIPSGAGSEQPGLFLPHVVSGARNLPSNPSGEEDVALNTCPAESASGAAFNSIPVVGPPTDRPAHIHADLNLSVRSYAIVTKSLTLVDIDGYTDPDAPQLAGITDAQGRPAFVEAYQVNDWDWSCQEDARKPWAGHGCRGDAITEPAVTLLALDTELGSAIRTPARNAEIYADNYVALVLYAEENRLTFVYTREDTAANGYVIHLEDFCVDADLLHAYRTQDSGGRSELPALHSLEQVGTAGASPLKVSVRDTGSFLDPRSRKDWWNEY